jgi:hypothetical protein
LIRRGFWLLTGAVLGVTGYRKVTRLAHTLTGGDGQPGRSLSAQRSTSAAKIAATAGFMRDVRDGMAEYRNLHREQVDRTLGSRSGQTLPGDGQLGRREP